MKTSSAKAKGRRLQHWAAAALRYRFCRKDDPDRKLSGDDIGVAVMGESGLDIKLSPLAKTVIPFDIECKNTETASPWAWMKQAKANTGEGRMPCVVFTRNREGDVYAMVRFEDLLRLL